MKRKRAPEVVKNLSISNCSFKAVEWDPAALRAVQSVADGLLNLTALFKSTNVNVETMIRVDNSVKGEGE